MRCARPFNGAGFGERIEAFEKGRDGVGDARMACTGERDREVGGREGT